MLVFGRRVYERSLRLEAALSGIFRAEVKDNEVISHLTQVGRLEAAGMVSE